MTNSIPASQLVNVIPSVLSAGGNPLSLNAVFLTSDTSVPVGTVMPFSTANDVSNWFGPGATETALASIYFAGFEGSNTLPGKLYFAQFNTAAVSAYLRGGSVASYTLAQLQALSGVLDVTVDGTPIVSAAINLSSAASFSAAAALITTALGTATCAYDALRGAFVVHSATTGTGSTIGFGSGSIAAGLKLTAATGAVTSQGAAANTPAGVMAQVSAATQNWATFMTVTEQTLSNKEAFAAWVQTKNDRFVYVCQDSDATALTFNATGCFGNIVSVAGDEGICPVYDTTGGQLAAFICGVTASIDFTETEGRITYAFKSQPGLVPQITDATTAANLESNGYNFYAQYATAAQLFQQLQPGSTPGRWKWLDAYVNQIYLNSALQLALMNVLSTSKSIPYNTAGYNILRQACLDPIQQALTFGAIQPGVALSAAQAASVNAAAGARIDGTLSSQGWYLQVLPASALVRAARGSPPMTLWYTDGGSIQSINLASIDVQ